MITISNLGMQFAGSVLFKNADLQFLPGNCYGVIGANGAGKSTFLKILSGELEPTSGTVSIKSDARMSILKQDQFQYDQYTILDTVIMGNQHLYDVMKEKDALYEKEDFSEEDGLRASELETEFAEMDGWEAESDASRLLQGLGIPVEQHYDLMANTDGRDKVKVLLAQALFGKPDIIMLDEPTNHLDMDSIAWLENYLLTYNGSVLIIAHDRYFLDKIVTKIIEIDNTAVTVFSGNYTDYAAKKAVLRNMKLKEYLNQQRDIKHQQEVITKLKQFNREKSIKRAESREKMLDKMELVDKPTELNDKMHIRLDPKVVSGNDVLTVKDLSKSFGDNFLFSGLDFEIKRGERVALIGNNGTGKTTILKIINGLIPADYGEITLGSKVTIGYYDQEHHVLDPDKTLFEEIQDAYPDLNNTQIRNTLAAFLFTGDEVFKYIRDLSGGERGRVSLAKLMLSNANFLILDEPTNHLDIVSKEILENALNNYTGTVFYVSHDRYFINTTATRIIELTGHTIVNYIGNYDYYIEKKDILTPKALTDATAAINDSMVSSACQTPSSAQGSSKAEWQQSKEEAARLKKLKNELKRTEDKISQTEERISAIDEEYNNPDIASDTAKLVELHNERTSLSEMLDELYEKWEELSEELIDK